jgi:hypothetical protein
MTVSSGVLDDEHASKAWFTYSACVRPGANTRSQCAAPPAWLALTVTCSDDGWHRARPAVPEAAVPVPAGDAPAFPPGVAVLPPGVAAPPPAGPAGVPAGAEQRGRGES